VNEAVHILSLCSVLASALFLCLGIYVLKMNPRARVNQIFSFTCLCFLFWAFSYTFFRGAADKETAWTWFKLSSVGWTLAPAFVLHFLLLVSRSQNRLASPGLLLGIYVPSVYFLVQGVSGALGVVDFVWTDFGWSNVYGALTPAFVGYLVYFSVWITLGLVTVVVRSRRSELLAEKRQAWLILCTGLPTIGMMAVSGILLPFLGIRSIPNVAHLFTAFWVLAIWYAISTYKLMILTPAAVATDVLETMADAVIMLSRRQRIVGVNRAAEELLSARESELRGSRLVDLFETDDATETETLRRLITNDGTRDLELRYRKKNLELVRLKVSTSFVNDRHGQTMGQVLVARDITEQVKTEEELKHLATHDPLTGLPNRSLLHDRLQRAVNRAARERRPFALLMFDLDGFKQVNDTFGQDVGDLVLKSSAERLTRCVRGLDTVCRLGGDEFLLVLEELIESGDSDIVAERMLAAFEEPIEAGEQTISISGSIGISTYPFDGLDAETLVKKADLALHSSKQKKKGGFEFYAPRMDAVNRERTKIEQGLRQALARDEFYLAFQPLVDFDTGRVAGIEALLRWESSEIGLVSPAKFIPVAERSGLIVPIGQWVLETACKISKEWQDAGLPAVPMGVNISAKQLQQDDFLELVETVLSETHLRPELLELELTESAAMEDRRHSQELLTKLRGLGVRIVIDDFGTGYSSLSRLKLLPMHAVKVDQSFIENIVEDPRDRALVMAMVAMARNLGVDVVAEGVESVDQLEVLRSFESQPVTLFRCDKLQGFLFSRPVSKDEVPELFYRTHHVMKATDGHLPITADGTAG
jgi:diguanylate cyclase (GGDEF)-like protein/PAS domain S-box-containing protein